ncbi:precursor of CEP5 [Syzygium oleosum]|uniref:precursor of CEP5 n=1 Tax=Syzygium oleosum TaxID=219896 RepID=UPI0011D2289F|nr:precursor of CEP5 [Syzygium oleosum]
MAQNQVLFAFLFLLLAFSLKLRSTQARELKLTTQKQNPFPNKLHNINKLLEKEPRKTMAEESKNLQGETSSQAVNTGMSSTSPLPPPLSLLTPSLPPPSTSHMNGFKPTTPGQSPGIGN